jgi:hypothetical protein
VGTDDAAEKSEIVAFKAMMVLDGRRKAFHFITSSF